MAATPDFHRARAHETTAAAEDNMELTMQLTSEGGKAPHKLVLCFDGTGNKFRGDKSDTNIVKLCKLLDRSAGGQFHYYQPGIGTYVNTSEGKQRGPYDRFVTGCEKVLDSMLGLSFHDHIIAGYTFIMRYYKTGDDIYIFGFSRGAYSARFLAEMLKNVGLLSRGNEEMIRFAWRTYEKYERATKLARRQQLEHYMKEFKATFCRNNVNITFLGLFDTVNSVGSLEVPGFRRSFPVVVSPVAAHVRHAISIDERRARFKPALFSMHEVDPTSKHKVDIKEVWFSGDHCDIGGGWYPPRENAPLLSDIPLAWMVREIRDLPIPENRRLKWNEDRVKDLFEMADSDYVLSAPVHDLLSFSKDDSPTPGNAVQRAFASFGQKVRTVGWWTMEIIPVFTRLELIDGKWVPTRFPPNCGLTRDMPFDAKVHKSVYVRKAKDPSYRPKNDNFPEDEETKRSISWSKAVTPDEKGKGHVKL